MDVLKLNLSTRFMKGIVTKLISKAVCKKLGYEVDIQLNDLQIENSGGKVSLHLNVDAEVNTDDFMKIVKSIGLD